MEKNIRMNLKKRPHVFFHSSACFFKSIQAKARNLEKGCLEAGFPNNHVFVLCE